MADAIDALLKAPVLLKPDNFTPLARTPWAGRTIARMYKRQVLHGRDEAIGESWEFSCDPAFPSRLVDADMTLAQLIERRPNAVLSPERAARSQKGCDVLVKLLNAASPLSVQVHPSDDDRGLKDNECGKPESWLVLDAAPGAGIFLGLTRAVNHDELRALLRDGSGTAGILQFVPVHPGDFFEIHPGVIHCIGPDVVLLEPQRVISGKTGKTYRLSDWGRRYDASGREDPVTGQSRELHLDAAMRLIDSQSCVGASYVESLKRQGRSSEPTKGVTVTAYPSNSFYAVYAVKHKEGGKLRLSVENGYGAMIVLGGEITANGKSLVAGYSALLPHATMPITLVAKRPSFFALVVPADVNVSFA